MREKLGAANFGIAKGSAPFWDHVVMDAALRRRLQVRRNLAQRQMALNGAGVGSTPADP